MPLETLTAATTTSCAASTASCPRVRVVRDVWPRKHFRAHAHFHVRDHCSQLYSCRSLLYGYYNRLCGHYS